MNVIIPEKLNNNPILHKINIKINEDIYVTSTSDTCHEVSLNKLLPPLNHLLKYFESKYNA